MKLLPLLFAIILVVEVGAQESAPPITAGAAAENNQSEFNLHFDYQIISAPTIHAIQLMEALQDGKTVEEATAKLHTMISKGEADLVGMLLLVTKSGNRAAAEDIDEIRYPIEFEPARLAAKDWQVIEAEDPTDPANPPQLKPATEDEKGAKPEAMAAMASTFETRNVGTTLELEPTWDQKTQRISVHLSVQRVHFAGMAKHKVVSGGAETVVEQPQFESHRVSTQLTLGNAQRVLLGTFKSSQKEGWLDLFLLRGTMRPVPSN